MLIPNAKCKDILPQMTEKDFNARAQRGRAATKALSLN